MANPSNKRGAAAGAEKPEPTAADWAAVVVRYQDANGEAQSVEVKHDASGAGPRSVDVPGGKVTMAWGESYPEALLSAHFDPGSIAVTPTDGSADPHAGTASSVLRTRLDQIVEQMDAAEALQSELEGIKYSLALRLKRDKVSAIETATGKWFAKKPSGKGAHPFPLTLGRERPRVLGKLSD